MEKLEETLKLFCITNADKIVGCDWYATKYCLGKCKYYNKKQEVKWSEEQKHFLENPARDVE